MYGPKLNAMFISLYLILFCYLGDDLEMLNTERTFADGTDSSVCVNIMIIDDVIDETTAEMFTVQYDTSDTGVTPTSGTTTVVIGMLQQMDNYGKVNEVWFSCSSGSNVY